MTLRTRLIATAVAATTASLAVAGSASAAFHDIRVKEVFLGALGNDSFVELQMPVAGENLVAGQRIRFYQSDGSQFGTSEAFAGNVDNAQSNRTILIGDGAVTNRDFLYNSASPLEDINEFMVAGGALCFLGSNDCVAWGNFVDQSSDFTGIVGENIAPGGIPAGSSLVRKVNRGCKTRLDAADDTNNSAADFFVSGTPSPRGNTQPVEGKACVPCAGRQSTITGTNGRDVLRGTPGADVIAGLGGRDTLRGRGGRDILCGGAGRDKLVGGKGRDVLRGGPGRDTQIQ